MLARHLQSIRFAPEIYEHSRFLRTRLRNASVLCTELYIMLDLISKVGPPSYTNEWASIINYHQNIDCLALVMLRFHEQIYFSRGTNFSQLIPPFTDLLLMIRCLPGLLT